MTGFTAPKTVSPCGCESCLCRRGPRCRCHDYNALLDLAIWDLGRVLHRPLARDPDTRDIRPAFQAASFGSILGSAAALLRMDTLTAACLLAFVLGAASGFLLAV